jgi:uncharacterized membrane protein/glutaredoxin
MNRRRSTPWIQRWSRPLIGVVALLGAAITAYLTVVKLSGGTAACPTSGCEQVLSSPYASVLGLPLTLFGFLGYASMAVLAVGPLLINPERQKQLRTQLENLTWLLLFVGATAMVVFSGYLMFLLAFKLKVLCIYCLASAALTLSLFTLALIGRAWPDVGQLLFTGFIVVMVVLVGVGGLYGSVKPLDAANNNLDPRGLAITTTSGPAEMALAQHLQSLNAKMYGAYWCPHCHDQKSLFGKQAFALIDYVECAPDGKNSRADLCKAAKIEGFPTWEIGGQKVDGTQALTKLAELSGYQGPRNFQNSVSGPVQN